MTLANPRRRPLHWFSSRFQWKLDFYITPFLVRCVRICPEVNLHQAVDANKHRNAELLDILNMAAGFSSADLRRGSA